MKLETSDLVGFIKQRHFQQVRALKVKPTLAIAVVGDEAASASFIRAKQRYGGDIGAGVIVQAIKGQAELIEQINTWNHDPAVAGIVVQLPLPPDFDRDDVIRQIDPAKDVDGLRQESPFEPATAKGIMWILASLSQKVSDLKFCVVGQGRLVGRPVSALLEQAGTSVDRCEPPMADLSTHIQLADVVISGVGEPGLIKRSMTRPGQIIIDAGTAESAGKLVGDVDPALYDDPSVQVTPVPGGVGPMTVAALFDNLLIAASR